MPTYTYTPLATITLTSAVPSVTFGSIPGTYADLILICSLSTGSSNARARLNNDSGASYTRQQLLVSGNSPSGIAATNDSSILVCRGNGGTSKINFMDYSSTNKHKTVLRRTDLGNAIADIASITWPNTSAVNNILIFGDGGNLEAGSTISLYGVIA